MTRLRAESPCNRPADYIKELVENSLDVVATNAGGRVQIYIEIDCFQLYTIGTGLHRQHPCSQAHILLFAFIDDAKSNISVYQNLVYPLIMDPLSVTLAVVSLTTAVKDMVELGQKIHESFAKVSNNLRNAQRVAEDIKEMAEEIEVFCEDHQDALDDMKGFRLAIQGLLGKFRDFETSILPLLPQTGGRRQDRFIHGWDAWRNNNKIEGSILDLQSDIMKLIRRFMMKSALRTEVKLETIHQETTRGLEVLEVIRSDVSALRVTAAATVTHFSYESSGRMRDEFNRNIVMFAKSTPSTSAPMLRTPNVITEELMTAAYIKLQVNSIAMTVEKMSTLPASTPTAVEKFRLSPMFAQGSMNITNLRHYIVRQVTHIRDCLDAERIQTVSIHDGAHALNELSIGLEILGMRPESVPVSNWAVTLARTLVDASSGGQPDLFAALAHYLLNQSVQFDDMGDKIQSIQGIEEAYAITQHLRNQYGGEAQFLILHSRVLLKYAKLVDNQRSIGMSIEAIQILEDILHVQAFTQSQSHGTVERVVSPSSTFCDRLFSSAQPITAIKSYAYVLQYLGSSLFSDGHPESALNLALLAIAVHRKIVSIHGPEHRVDLAMALSSLVQGGSAISSMPAEDLVVMADECTQLLRELATKNPLFYARELVSVLWEKARVMQTLDRDAEAIATWEEVANLAGQIVQDSELCATALGNLSNQFRRLKRHNDAVRTGMLAIATYQQGAETEAQIHFFLSLDLQQLRRYKEAAEAARKSVALYRLLAMRDPGRWMCYLSAGLSRLAHCLAASGDYSEALIAWKESVNILASFLNASTDASSAVMDIYLHALDTSQDFSVILENDDQCLAVCSTAVQCLHQLSKTCQQNEPIIGRLLETEFYYAYNMLRVGRLQDAQQYIDHWLDAWSRKPPSISESQIAATHAAMVIMMADVLDAQGCTDQALLTTQKVLDIVRLSVTTYQPSFSQMIDSMIHEAGLQVNLGNSEHALQVAERALWLSRKNKLEPIVENLVWSLHAVALAALSCRNYKRAVEAAQEGCNTSASPNWRSTEREDSVFIRPSLFALLSYAEANLGRWATAIECAHRAVDASLDIRNMKSHISATTAERSYMETRANLANILLATSNLAQARQICEECGDYFSKRVEKRVGDYRELAPILRMLGILCCSEGRHKEGEAAAKELFRIVTMLGSAFPSLQEQVKIRLRHQAQVPILKVLSDMSQKLDCKHQVEVGSLLEI